MMRWKESPGFGKLPTDRTLKRHSPRNPSESTTQPVGEKNRTKRSVLVDEHGIPLSLVVSGANRHDSVSLKPLPEETVIAPENQNALRNLCRDAGYAGKEEGVKENGFLPHIRPRDEEKQLIERDPTFKARRWVVERTHSWFNRLRKLIPRYEKTNLSYRALNSLAAVMSILNKIMAIYR
jgi:transposase